MASRSADNIAEHCFSVGLYTARFPIPSIACTAVSMRVMLAFFKMRCSLAIALSVASIARDTGDDVGIIFLTCLSRGPELAVMSALTFS